MNLHKLKQKIARKISGLQKGHFKSWEWKHRKGAIEERVKKRIAKEKALAKRRKEAK